MTELLELPNCKSIIIRKMMITFIDTGELWPEENNECGDVVVTRNALSMIRNYDNNKRMVTIEVQDCGTAYRFLMALLAVTPGKWHLTGTLALLQRPMPELITTLQQIGADIQPLTDGWLIKGKTLQASELTIDCTRSSQFASALLLIAPRLGLQKLHIIPADYGSKSYVRLTKLCIKEMRQKNRAAANALGREGDWSAAVYGYALALLHPENSYVLTNLSLCSAQGDRVVSDWFAELGVESEETSTGLSLKAVPIEKITAKVFNAANHLDLVPVMSALAVLLPATFTFHAIRNLQYKESNRLTALMEQLTPFAKKITLKGDSLKIIGAPRDQWPQPPYPFFTHNDHRLAMAFLLFGQEAQIDDLYCLCKSYPQLYRREMKER